MGLNKSVGNMYEWVTHTWNPVKGCKFDCSYCYIKSNPRYSLEPRFSEREMKTDLGSGKIIFVGSMCDMFGDWVPDEWIERVLEYCNKFENGYLFQSKNPLRFHAFLKEFPPQVVLGTTIETNRNLSKISKAPTPLDRAFPMRGIHLEKEVTIEPIMDFDMIPMIGLIKGCEPRFVAIGADSKGHGLDEPSEGKVWELIKKLELFTSVKLKKNLRRIYKKGGNGERTRNEKLD